MTSDNTCVVGKNQIIQIDCLFFMTSDNTCIIGKNQIIQNDCLSFHDLEQYMYNSQKSNNTNQLPFLS